MNVSQFLDHWGIAENPFRGEEARHDDVLVRLNRGDGSATRGSMHSDFEKILGELARPSTSIVFGEKGSGKTAIKLQIEERTEAHNREHPEAKVFLVSYDDLNQPVAEMNERFGSRKDELAPFKKWRLVDHMDGILSIATDRMVAALFDEAPDRPAADLGVEPWRAARRMAAPLRHDLLLLQAVYDPADTDGGRTGRLRRLLRLTPDRREILWRLAVAAGWIPAAAMLFVWLFPAQTAGEFLKDAVGVIFLILLAAYVVALVKRFVWDRVATRRIASRVHDEMRTTPRSTDSLAASLATVDHASRTHTHIPMTDGADEPRYAMFERLRRVLSRFGYRGILVVVDRVDEPTLVNGDADKMREIVWPLLNNKFLQQDRFGLKLLLPIELRHALYKESAVFFQEARLDKQGFVERLTWSGPMLYDLCNARLQACRRDDAQHISLIDLFAEDVSRQDLVDALDQMHQPRDAFKFLYRCFNEHCSNVTAEEDAWRVPRLVLDSVRKVEADRVQQLYRGISPA